MSGAGTNQSQAHHVGPECPEKVNVLLIGGGGREHALAWKMSQSARLGRLWVTGVENPGLAELGEACPVVPDYKEMWRLIKWCDRERIDFVVVGPESPLAAGIADALTTDKRLVFGPKKAGARLESDKAWAKQLMRSAAIPTADGRVFANAEQAMQYLKSRDAQDLPVIKASGLAGGKGVIVPATLEEAVEAVDRIMRQGEFGAAGERIVVEERLHGPEASVLALVDGRTIYMLEPCQDHKRLLDGDEGPNTGGMGAYCPVPWLDEAMMRVIEQSIFVPTVDALRREEIEFRGVMYAGLIFTPAGPKVLEFNARFGDPECQPIMMRLNADLVHMLWATAAGRLEEVSIDWDARPACAVVMAARGYPGTVTGGGQVITGLEEAAAIEDVMVFHAGTKRRVDGAIVTAGGRVLSVTARGQTVQQARERAIAACGRIRFEGAHYRRDIGRQALSGTAGLRPVASA